MKAVRIEAPIEGALKNTINVGDTVMCVTTGYSHNVSVRKGKYLGYINGTGYYKKRAQVEVESLTYTRMWKDTNTEYAWNGQREKDFRAQYETQKDYWSAYSKALEEATYIKEEPYTWVTTLNLNRIATITPAEAATVATISKLV